MCNDFEEINYSLKAVCQGETNWPLKHDHFWLSYFKHSLGGISRGAITNITEMLFYSFTYSKFPFKSESLMKFKDAEESRSSLGSDMILISEVKMNSAENCNLYLPYISSNLKRPYYHSKKLCEWSMLSFFISG